MAIRNAEENPFSQRAVRDWKLKRVIQRSRCRTQTDWSKRQYSDDAKAKIEERAKLWSPELQEQVTKDWDQLPNVKASLGEDPASPKAQALAARWKTLVSGFTGGDPEVTKGLNAMYADRENWPTEQKEWFRCRRRSGHSFRRRPPRRRRAGNKFNEAAGVIPADFSFRFEPNRRVRHFTHGDALPASSDVALPANRLKPVPKAGEQAAAQQEAGSVTTRGPAEAVTRSR